MTEQSWYRVSAAGESRASIEIDGEIGAWGVTSDQFKSELKDLGDVKNIKVRLNTIGGSVADGVAIKNALRDHPAKVNIQIDGYALSIGSVIAMGGNTVSMSEDSLFMIHNPWSLAIGDANDMRHEAEVLDKHQSAIIAAYQSRKQVNLDESELQEAMDYETWYTAEEAREAGFIDRVNTDAKNSRSVAYAKFDPNRFKNAPQDFTNRLTEKLNKTNSGSAADPKTKGNSMTDEKKYSEDELQAAVKKAKTDAIAEHQSEDVSSEAAETLAAMLNDENATIERVREACDMGLSAEQASKYMANIAFASKATKQEAPKAETPSDLLQNLLNKAQGNGDLDKVNKNAGEDVPETTNAPETELTAKELVARAGVNV